MLTAAPVDVRDIVLSNSTFGPREITQLSQSIAEDYAQFGVLRDAVAEFEARDDRTPAASVRLGVCYFLLGRYRMASSEERQRVRQALDAHLADHYPEL